MPAVPAPDGWPIHIECCHPDHSLCGIDIRFNHEKGAAVADRYRDCVVCQRLARRGRPSCLVCSLTGCAFCHEVAG